MERKIAPSAPPHPHTGCGGHEEKGKGGKGKEKMVR